MIAAGAFALGIYEAGAAGRADRAVASEYVHAWAHGDYRTMYSLLDASSRHRLGEVAFARAYARANDTATLESIRVLHVGSGGSVVDVSARAKTALFGTLHGTLEVPVDDDGSGPQVHFSPSIVFPGLRPGESLHRVTHLAARGTIRADDGTPLAEGPDRTSPIPQVADAIVGSLGPIPRDEAAYYMSLGYPANARVGQDGLELVFQNKLAGRIGGTLLAGRRVLASVAARPGQTVRTTINPSVEQATLSALGNTYSGMSVMDPRTGAILAAAGLAYSDTQPPGSTMKIVTVTAALGAHLTTLRTVYPYATSADVGGYILHNAGGEDCGGTLLNAFAVSCNSVFAPLGVKVGAERLVGTAERFGFDSVPTIPGELESTIPSASAIGGPTAVGSSAIGQGAVSASTLEMADVGATIAMGGRRPIPTLLYGAKPVFVHVTSRTVAREVQQMMIAVIAFGTGTAAAIPGVEVAGKTGTAELTDTGTATNDPKATDAWFVGYAPVGHPRVVACALFPADGSGGATAAPAVREAMIAALESHY